MMESPFPMMKPPICRKHENCYGHNKGLIVTFILTLLAMSAILLFGLAQPWWYG